MPTCAATRRATRLQQWVGGICGHSDCKQTTPTELAAAAVGRATVGLFFILHLDQIFFFLPFLLYIAITCLENPKIPFQTHLESSTVAERGS